MGPFSKGRGDKPGPLPERLFLDRDWVNQVGNAEYHGGPHDGLVRQVAVFPPTTTLRHDWRDEDQDFQWHSFVVYKIRPTMSGGRAHYDYVGQGSAYR